jgi:hypothetical protein
MSYRPSPRLRVRRIRNKCALCREVATRFIDLGPVRIWYCATHFEQQRKGE